MNRLALVLKAARELGLQQVGLYAVYRFGLLSGHYRRVTSRPTDAAWADLDMQALFTLPTRAEIQTLLGKEGLATLLAEAGQIISGRVRLFGAEETLALNWSRPTHWKHWTAYETGQTPLPLAELPFPDIKYLWEPARFGWAFTLGRAYHLTGEERYCEAFWQCFEAFSASNPPEIGPHWMSGQEVALRLMAWVWAAQVFQQGEASTPERQARLAAEVAAHAARIGPTLVYGRAQHNNHLLTEAAGLLTAGLALPNAPQAARWKAMGWKWLNHGLQTQIDPYGEYSQHSSNYQRLMLAVVLWTNTLLGPAGLLWPRASREAVQRAVHWALALTDAASGGVPNLGANDGADILPLSGQPFGDHRPVLHAAARVFLDYDLPHGPWDELAFWLGGIRPGTRLLALPRYLGDQLYGRHSWAYFRTAQYTCRPSHADQLHLDLWWHNLNIARDAGTYLYNTGKPWDNSLVTAFVHNTVTVNGRDQMTRAGRFLYLDRVNAYRKALPLGSATETQRLQGRFRAGGFRHTRTVAVDEDDRWQVTDALLSLRPGGAQKPFAARLHWLLPDWEWEWEVQETSLLLRLRSPREWVRLTVRQEAAHTCSPLEASLVRAGQVIGGTAAADPVRGWTSPTYGIKIPALSLAVIATGQPEIVLCSEFIFPSTDSSTDPNTDPATQP